MKSSSESLLAIKLISVQSKTCHQCEFWFPSEDSQISRGLFPFRGRIELSENQLKLHIKVNVQQFHQFIS